MNSGENGLVGPGADNYGQNNNMDLLDVYATKMNIAIWLVPCSMPVMNGEVTWGWEMEFLPYRPIGEWLGRTKGSYMAYSYKEWPTYEEAKASAIEHANVVYNEWVKSTST